jgi:hypothetical protein
MLSRKVGCIGDILWLSNSSFPHTQYEVSDIHVLALLAHSRRACRVHSHSHLLLISMTIPQETKLTKATYLEWQMSLFGASFIAFGLGVLLAGYLPWLATPALIVGVVMHGWGMYRIHERNKS